MNKNFERMLQLADEVFDSRSDPDQIDVNPDVLDHLRRIHPATVCEHANDDGPVAWVLLIPTTRQLMKEFMADRISEKDLLEKTPLDIAYEAIYLCSAMVLEEFRQQGLATRLSLEAITAIRADHPIRHLFVWTFSKEGLLGAESIARRTGLPLLQKQK